MYDGEWMENKGFQPVPNNVMVDYILRNLEIVTNKTAGTLDWSLFGDSKYDIRLWRYSDSASNAHKEAWLIAGEFFEKQTNFQQVAVAA